MKFLIGQVIHETNTFASTKTTKDYFELWEWVHGEEIIKEHKGVKDYLGGMLDEAESENIEVIPTFSANAMPSGIITKDTCDLIIENLINSIKKSVDYDAVCLALHGAGVAEGIDDLEGYILKSVRETTRDSIPVVATLDLHGNLTETMINNADALLGVNYYPHVDSYERGREAVVIAKKIALGEINPVMELKKVPLIIPTSTTNLAPANEINTSCWEEESKESIIDCTFFHGFPYTDIPDVGVSVLAISDGNKELATKAADNVSKEIWVKREAFFPKIISPSEGIAKAIDTEGKPVVINETSDNPGGGTPGDGTHLLQAMLEANLNCACMGFICDPEAVKIAHKSGIGKNIKISLGGKTDNLHGLPLEVDAYVKTLSDGRFVQTSPMGAGSKVNYGLSARIQVQGIDIIVCTKKSQTLDEQIFLLHGIDISQYEIVSLKSSQHFRAAFEKQSFKIITVDAPGLSSFNLKSLNHKRIKRPVYPFDTVNFT